MIPGNSGPIIFPFKSIGQEVLTINRNQLVLHNSHIAVLAAAGISSQTCIPNIEEIEVPTEEHDSNSWTSSSVTMPQSSTADSSPPSSCSCAAIGLGLQQQEPILEAKEAPQVPHTPQDPPRLQEPLGPKEPQSQMAGHSLSSVSMQLMQCTAVQSNGKSEQTSHLVLSAHQMQVSKLDANVFLQQEWEKLVNQLDELDIDYPDGCGMYMTEFADELASASPMVISEGALRLYQKAKDLGCPEWANRFILLIGHRILTISKGQLFLGLGPETVCEILGSDYLDVANEPSVFRAANRWLDHDTENRSQDTPNVMGCVRYGLMPKEDLIKYVVTRRHLKKSIMAMPPFQRSLTNGLIWMAMTDLDLNENFPKFAPVPRIHPVLHMRRQQSETSDNNVSLPKSKVHLDSNMATPHKHAPGQGLDSNGNGGKHKKAIHLISQVGALDMNVISHAGRQHGGRGGRYN